MVQAKLLPLVTLPLPVNTRPAGKCAAEMRFADARSEVFNKLCEVAIPRSFGATAKGPR